MLINKTNIIPFISHLYWERKKEAPPEELLESWRHLNDAEIQEHLHTLFESWGYTPAAADREIALFLARQRPANPAADNLSAPTTPGPVAAPGTPPPYQPPVFATPDPLPPPPVPNYTPPAQPQYRPPQNYPPPARRKSRRGAWSLLLLLIVALGIGVYALFEYTRYTSLKRVYTITDNVAIRDEAGDVVGRMDVYGNPAKNSFSSLRALDRKEHPLMVGGKEYNYRKVLADSATFKDFLFRKGEHTYYVSANYMTDNKDDYQLYREVFKAINNNDRESARLTSDYRQVIIGSLRAGGDTKLYVTNTCNNQNKDLTSVWKAAAPGGKVKLVAAKMSDGQYYLFAGNPQSNVFEAPQPLYFKAPNLSELQPLTNRDLLFKQSGSNVYLYQCNGKSTDFFATQDSEGKIKTFQWSFNPAATPQ